jgi:hypothetical protein
VQAQPILQPSWQQQQQHQQQAAALSGGGVVQGTVVGLVPRPNEKQMINQLVGMGFTVEACVDALKVSIVCLVVFWWWMFWRWFRVRL